MCSVYLLLFILTIRTDGFTLDKTECNPVFKQKCYGNVNNYNVVTYDSSAINYCSVRDIPTEFHLTEISANYKRGKFKDLFKIAFETPKRECGYGVTLLVEPSIEDERECLQYKFDKVEDNINIHTIKKPLCFLTNNSNQFIRYNDNSTVSSCKDDILLDFYYIFTGCYALQFHLGEYNYIIGPKFLNTTYTRMEVTEPEFTCKYDVYPTFDQSYKINFTLYTTLSVDTGPYLRIGVIPDDNKNLCILSPKPSMEIFHLEKATENCGINVTWENGKYVKTVQCNFQKQLEKKSLPTTLTTQTAGYCVVLYVIDQRCHKDTIWRPPISENEKSCMWLKRCTRIFETSQHIEDVTKSNHVQYTDSYLLLPIIAIILVVLVIVGASYFINYLRRTDNLYVSPRQDDFTNPTCLKSTDFDIVEVNDNKKDIDGDNLAYDDIVLLYTKSSVSFMTMMKDFREILTKMCSCTVHDWYDGVEWNDVARVGAVLWFTRLLNSGCRVIWIDTPATRSVVISNSRESDTNLNKLSKYHEIGDFRDVAFPVVLELAKRNTKDLMFQYRKHFVVRFEGLESSENVNDPYLDLSPHARYLMPQHFAQLCSDISAIQSADSRYEMKAEEDLLQQRLKYMKMESIMSNVD